MSKYKVFTEEYYHNKFFWIAQEINEINSLNMNLKFLKKFFGKIEKILFFPIKI